MKKLFLPLIACGLLLMVSCKKDHNCVCTNSYGSYQSDPIKNTKHRAKKQCEALSIGETKCTIK